jgi:hypothetical protein
MPQTPPHTPLPPTDATDLPRLVQPLRRHATALLSAALLAGGLTYLLAAQQAPSYRTMSSVVAAGGEEDSLLDGSRVSAPPLAADVLQQALRDDEVIEDIAARVLAADLPPAQAQALARTVRGQRNTTAFTLVEIETPGGTRSNLYEVWGNAGTPAAARVLVNSTVDALRAWDRERAQQRIALARSSLQQQLAALNRNEPDLYASDVRWETFQTIQAQLLRSLSRLDVLAPAAVGTLDVVARATEPRQATGSGPLRRAGLAALLTLFAASGAVLLFEAWRRRVYDARGLRDLGVPLLGHLTRPGVPGAALSGTALAGTALSAGALPAALPDSVGFLRVNVLPLLTGDAPRRLVFAGMQDSAGSGGVVEALAASLAAEGRRVLIVDTQAQRLAQAPGLQGLPQGDAETRSHADIRRADASGAYPGPVLTAELPTRRVTDHVDLLPLGGLGAAQGRATVDALTPHYDVTLIDTPPLLRRPDALLWGAAAAGVVLVMEPGASSASEVEQALQSAGLARVRVLGAVLSELRLPAGPRRAAADQRLGERGVSTGEATAR